MIPQDESEGRLSPARRIGGFAIAVVGTVTTSVALLPDRERVGPESVLLVLIMISVIASAVGGVLPAATAAVLGFLAVNLFFTPPYDTLVVQHPMHLVDLIVFVGIAVGVGLVVEAGSRARVRAARTRTLASAISELDRREYGDHDNVDRLLIDALDRLGMDRAELVMDEGAVVVAGVPEGDSVAARVPAGERLELRLYGPRLHGIDAALLEAFGATAGRLWRCEQFAARAVRAEDRARTAQQGSDQVSQAVRELAVASEEIRTLALRLRETGAGSSPVVGRDLAAIESRAHRVHELLGGLPGSDPEAAASSDRPRAEASPMPAEEPTSR